MFVAEAHLRPSSMLYLRFPSRPYPRRRMELYDALNARLVLTMKCATTIVFLLRLDVTAHIFPGIRFTLKDEAGGI